MINIGIIGSNFGKRVHIPAFQSIENVNIAKICKDHNWQDIVEDQNIDAVCISVPPSESFDIIAASIKNKKHIFTEKPLAVNLENAYAISDLLDNDIITAVNFEICESKIVKKLRDLISNKHFGEIKSFNLQWNVVNFGNPSNWKYDVNLGGGLINNFGSHILNLLEYVFDDKMSCKLDIELSDHVVFDCSFDSFIGDVSIKYIVDDCQDFTLTIYCDRGKMILSNNTSKLKNFSLRCYTKNKRAVSVFSDDYVADSKNKRIVSVFSDDDISDADGRIDLTNSLARKFISGILNKKQIHPNISDGVRVQELINKLR
jgi:predicted dehydrogenase